MSLSRWANDLSFGARLALAGGREGRLRTTLAAVGVGLGVALLLVAASTPTMLAQRHYRGSARDYESYSGTVLATADNTMLVGQVDTEYRDAPIRGKILRPEGVHAPVPPGLTRNPGPNELMVSPALADLLASPDGASLRERFTGRIVGTIGDEGLAGPNELAYYLGSDRIQEGQRSIVRIDHFGDESTSEGLDPVLLLLVLVIFVVLLLPIGVFVAAAVRFGGERRDRRLAAVRLVGADGAMARRIAAGEALLGAVLGLVVGAVLFLVGRQLMQAFTVQNLSVFASDVRPSLGLIVLIVLAVPVAAVVVTVLALRRVIIEPLGVVRQSRDPKRRLWWRLLVPAAGLALLYPLLGGITPSASQFNEYQVVAGITLLLLGTATLLPWLVQAAVRRLGGGGVSWQLAIRRLQLDGNTSVRAVTGIAVAAAGAIALQMLFAAADTSYTRPTGQDASRAQVVTDLSLRQARFDTGAIERKLRATAGVTSVASFYEGYVTLPLAPGLAKEYEQSAPFTVGDCAGLRELAIVDACADGDVFIFQPRPDDHTSVPQAGQQVGLGLTDDPASVLPLPQWTIPATAATLTPRPDAQGGYVSGLYLTAGAAAAAGNLPVRRYLSYLTEDLSGGSTEGDTIERIRNVAASVDPTMDVRVLHSVAADPKFTDIRRGLYIGAFATLLLIGASLLVSMVEQLRDRRRLLAALVAFGTRRATLSWSLLWQAAVPVFLGVALAIVAGTALGGLLLRMVGGAVRFDWRVIATVAGAATGVVGLVTVLSLPVLWRLMRPEGLRTE